MSILCRVFGHKVFVIESFSPYTRKVGCHRCPQTFGMNDRVKAFIPWDDELQELHYPTSQGF